MADVLILVGSPRKKGDTLTLATQAAHGLVARNKAASIRPKIPYGSGI